MALKIRFRNAIESADVLLALKPGSQGRRAEQYTNTNRGRHCVRAFAKQPGRRCHRAMPQILRHVGLSFQNILENKIVLGSIVIKSLGILLSFAAIVVLARSMGPREYGTYVYVISIVAILSIPLRNGLSTLVIRESARARELKNTHLLKGVWIWSAYISVSVSLAAMLIIVAVFPAIKSVLSTHHYSLLIWTVVLLPLLMMCDLRSAALIGINRVIFGQLSENVLRPGGLVVLVLLEMQVFHKQLNATHALILTVSSTIVALIVIEVALRRYAPSDIGELEPVINKRAWISSLGPFVLISGIYALNHNVDLLMLGFLRSPQEVGIYRVATQGAMVVAFVLGIVNVVFAPQIARLHAKGDMRRLQAVVSRSARIALIGAIPSALILVVFGGSLLRLAFGSEYATGWAALAILSIGQLFNVAAGPVGLLLNMSGYERRTARGVAIGVIVNILLNVTLIPYFGMLGAAFATSTSLVVWNLILYGEVRRMLDIQSTAFPLTIRGVRE